MPAEQAQLAADAEAARQRRDMAMVESYATEADLRRAYGERISLLDDSLKASQLDVANLRQSLVSLLDQASDLELSGKPVPAGAASPTSARQHARTGAAAAHLRSSNADRSGAGRRIGRCGRALSRVEASGQRRPNRWRAYRRRRRLTAGRGWSGSFAARSAVPPLRESRYGNLRTAAPGPARPRAAARGTRPGCAPAPSVVGLEAQHQHRRGVRRAHQAEAVRLVDAQAVDGRRSRRALELRRRRGSVSTSACGSPSAHATLSSGVDTPSGSASSTVARRSGCAREDLEQARAGVDAVVEAVPALAEEDVAAHLAGELGARSPSSSP